MKKCLLILFTLLLANNVLNAQWVSTNGPYGGSINCIAINGSNIFAGTTRGVFLSSDNGLNWTQKNNGLS